MATFDVGTLRVKIAGDPSQLIRSTAAAKTALTGMAAQTAVASRNTRRMATASSKAAAAQTGLAAATGQVAGRQKKVAGIAGKVGANFGKLTASAIAARAAFLGASVTMTALAASTLGGVKAAIDFEQAFTGVRKTTDATEAQFAELEASIRDMSTEIPIAADELAKIAEISGQLGVGVEDIETFTRVIAELGVTTDLATEQAAFGMARLLNVMGEAKSRVDPVSDALVELGNNVAATESEILDLSTRIAAVSAPFGVATDEVLGMAAAVRELGLRPQAAASAIGRAFANMEKAIGEGGDQLEAFTKVTGTTVEEFQNLFRNDPTELFVRMIQGVSDATKEGQNLTLLLDDLGLGSIRVSRNIKALSQNVGVLERDLQIAADGMAEGTARTEEFGLFAETTSAKLKTLFNTVVEFARSMGEALLPAIKSAAESLTGFFKAARSLVPIVKALGTAVARGLSVIIPFAAALGGLKVAGALATRLVPLSTAIGQIGTTAGTTVPALIGLRRSFGRLVGFLSGPTGLAALLGVFVIQLRNAKEEGKKAGLAFQEGLGLEAIPWDETLQKSEEFIENLKVTRDEASDTAGVLSGDLGSALRELFNRRQELIDQEFIDVPFAPGGERAREELAVIDRTIGRLSFLQQEFGRAASAGADFRSGLFGAMPAGRDIGLPEFGDLPIEIFPPDFEQVAKANFTALDRIVEGVQRGEISVADASRAFNDFVAVGGDVQSMADGTSKELLTLASSEMALADEVLFANRAIDGQADAFDRANQSFADGIPQMGALTDEMLEVIKAGEDIIFTFDMIMQQQQEGVDVFLAATQDNARHFENFINNINELAARGAVVLARQLAEEGVGKAGKAAQQAVDATQPELARMEEVAVNAAETAKKGLDLVMDKWPRNLEDKARKAVIPFLEQIGQIVNGTPDMARDAFGAMKTAVEEGMTGVIFTTRTRGGEFVQIWRNKFGEFGTIIRNSQGDFIAFRRNINGEVTKFDFDPAKISAEQLAAKLQIPEQRARELLEQLGILDRTATNHDIFFHTNLDTVFARIRSITRFLPPSLGGPGGGFTAPSFGFSQGGLVDSIQKLAEGGRVNYLRGGGTGFRPMGTDTVPAMLTPGEYVINRDTVQRLGVGFFEAVNRFKDGGSVGGTQHLHAGGSVRTSSSGGGNDAILAELRSINFKLNRLGAGPNEVRLDLNGREVARGLVRDLDREFTNRQKSRT